MYCGMADEPTAQIYPETKKRRIGLSNETYEYKPNPECMVCKGSKFMGHNFVHFRKVDNERVYQTEDWEPSGSALFYPLTEDVMVNSRNIEQFSCSSGNFFVAGQDGLYSRTLSGKVLHLWRFCTEKKKLYISRSFLFRNAQDFWEVQQMLERL
ncbi:uncharacterized protein LOC101856049 [Aplysia californica]|uniref:Uncharacterized protein LOC101856049 n=1 Tax=Aplysia californica TaxID=6500 RepID=A0ABM1W0D6_APLCA|nr:uncharacterized protein LOC101856049 [Aplysia californica]XP_035828129.1 uncharacterized protein LOC101856049 [Aplysia californica]XP_035828130.1 uncharacterized protein LOC101856049 [Aplysia californica]